MEALANLTSTIRTCVNYLLPFTNPSTPLWQDATHTLILCVILYYAPTFIEDYTARHLAQERAAATNLEYTGEPNDAAHQSEDDADELRTNGNAINIDDHEFEQLGGEDRAPEALIPAAEDDIDAEPVNGLARVAGSGPSIRNVGKKKAASLARKDQKRAYHEFQRAQGEAQRARDREVEEATRQEVEEARLRRKRIEEEVERKAKLERERKREEERLEREREAGRRTKVIERVRGELRERGWVRLKGIDTEGLDVDIVERLCRAEGIVGEKSGEKVISTTTGYLVKIESTDLTEAYQRALIETDRNETGKISWDTLSQLLEQVIMRKVDVRTGKSPRWDWEREKARISKDKWDEEVEHPAHRLLG